MASLIATFEGKYLGSRTESIQDDSGTPPSQFLVFDFQFDIFVEEAGLLVKHDQIKTTKPNHSFWVSVDDAEQATILGGLTKDKPCHVQGYLIPRSRNGRGNLKIKVIKAQSRQ